VQHAIARSRSLRHAAPVTDLLADLDDWIATQWDPALTAGAWWERLGDAGWAAPSLPPGRFGRGASPDEASAIAARLVGSGALPPPSGAGLSVVAPALAAHLADDELATELRPTVTGRLAWCLLFSEPGAGTDLAGVTTTATRDGDGWRLDGRKTWATGAHVADRALVLARSDPESSRHRGLTCFVLDMRQDDDVVRAAGAGTGGGPGPVEVRPMREMTGRALSNDVWLRGAWTATPLGDVGDGWRVVNTALTAERTSVGAHRASPGRPGSLGGDLERLAGDVATRPARRRTSAPAPEAIARAAAQGRPGAVRDDLAGLLVDVEVARLTAGRAARVAGAPHVAKLWAGAIARRSADVASAALGAAAMLHDYRDGDGPDAAVTSLVLSSPAVSLVGGVDLVQRDLLGERVLGLPKGP